MTIPQEFINEIESYNCPTLTGLVEALAETEPETSIRSNLGKNIGVPEGVERVPWCNNGWYLPRREAFTFDPAMHQGLYYVQDASSMIYSHIVSRLTAESSAPLRYLDACAAPGGKTTAAIDTLPAKSLVVANEYVAARASVLCENLVKWGSTATIVTKGDATRFGKLGAFFDIIAADVPCSGEGMMRKESEAVAQWSPALVKECAERQRLIVESLWEALRPGGYMIYSTCTFNRHENEEIVEHLCQSLGAESIDLDLPSQWHIASGVNTACHCYRFMPHITRGEGLFVAVVRKSDDAPCSSAKVPKAKGSGTNRGQETLMKQVKAWLTDSDEMEYMLNNDTITAFPRTHAQALQLVSQHLDVLHYGITLAAIKGKDLIPHQSLALSPALNPNAFPRHEIDYPTAIAYLRRESIVLADAPRGYVLLTHNDRPLGFVKNLGNRANNLYPQQWRILSTHLPDACPSIIYSSTH